MREEHLPPPGERPFPLKHLRTIADRETTSELATPDQIKSMTSAVASVMQRPGGVSAPAFGDAAAALFVAPLPIVARALLAVVRGHDTFTLNLFYTFLEREKALDEARRHGAPLPEFPPSRWRPIDSPELDEAEAQKRSILSFPT